MHRNRRCNRHTARFASGTFVNLSNRMSYVKHVSRRKLVRGSYNSFCLHREKTIYGFACPCPAFDSEPGSNYCDTCRFYNADSRGRYFTRIKNPDNKQLRDIFIGDGWCKCVISTPRCFCRRYYKIINCRLQNWHAHARRREALSLAVPEGGAT